MEQWQYRRPKSDCPPIESDPVDVPESYDAYLQHSAVEKILEIHQELPGRIHVILIRQPVGF